MLKKFFLHSKAAQIALVGVFAVLVLLAGISNALANGATTGLANLQHTPTGTANLHADANGHVLTVTITLTGLAPKSIHPAHIHAGNSCASNGPILYPLKNVVANAKGEASVTTVVHLSKAGIPSKGWYINVHNGPTLATPQQMYAIACGVIANRSHTHNVLTFLGPTPDPNQNATGYTHLYIKDGKLVVHIVASGLAPNSTHMAHVHAGNCFYTKQVLFNLSPLVANAKGVADKTVTFDNVKSIPASGWDVNVHLLENISTQTGYDPILCGDVVRG